MTATAQELASRFGGEIEGDGLVSLFRLASLGEAGEGDLSFLSNRRYAGELAKSRASAVVVSRDCKADGFAGTLIRTDNPDRFFSRASALLAPPPPVRTAGIDPTAVVSGEARIGKNVHIGPYTVIEKGAEIGDGCVIEAQCFIGESVSLGRDSHLYPGVKIREGVKIGDRFIAHMGAVIGSDGFGYSVEISKAGIPAIEKIPQVGIVEIGHDVEIGANATIDRARFGKTSIGDFVKIDNLVQIGHNVKIGAFSGVIAQAGIAGSTTVGSGVRIWAQAGLSGHLKIGDGAQVGPQCGVTSDVPPGSYVIGTPEQSLRNLVALKAAPGQISELKKTVRALARRIEELEKGRD